MGLPSQSLINSKRLVNQMEVFEQVLAMLSFCSPVNQQILHLPGNATCYPKYVFGEAKDMGGVVDGSVLPDV